MFRAALKSLLGRKVRLLMSTFAIVLGVAFVAGTLVFSDTLSRSFTALMASTVGDVVVRPAGTSGESEPTARTVDASLVDRLQGVEGAARVDGNVTAFGVFVVGEDNKVVGGQGPPAIGANWNDAPAGHDLEGLALIGGRAPERAGEVVLDSVAAGEGGYTIGEEVHLITSGQRAVLRPKLVGIVGFPEGGSLNGVDLAPASTPVRRSGCCSTARTPTATSG